MRCIGQTKTKLPTSSFNGRRTIPGLFFIDNVDHAAGSFACIRAYFHLERRLRAYILSTYLPSMLVVLLSWVSFWIDLESAPARISLGIVTVLTITIQSSGQGRFPAVSFTKAIDVWMATCLVFVFGAFIEYSIVNVLARREKINAIAIRQASATGGIAQVSQYYSRWFRSNRNRNTAHYQRRTDSSIGQYCWRYLRRGGYVLRL